MAGLNVRELFYGTLDAGIEIEIYLWGGNYATKRKRARFFSVSPDPEIPISGGATVQLFPNVVQMEITRTWNTVWTDENGNHTFQSNVALKNIGAGTTSYHLYEAETDN